MTTYMFKRFRIHQTLTACVIVACLTSLLTACLPSLRDHQWLLISLRMMYGLCQSIIMAHGPLWARRTAPKHDTRKWLALFQASIPLGVTIGYLCGAWILITEDMFIRFTFYYLQWRLLFIIQCLILSPFIYLFYKLPDEQLGVFPWKSKEDQTRLNNLNGNNINQASEGGGLGDRDYKDSPLLESSRLFHNQEEAEVELI